MIKKTKNPLIEGLNVRIPMLIPIKERWFINQGSRVYWFLVGVHTMQNQNLFSLKVPNNYTH